MQKRKAMCNKLSVGKIYLYPSRHCRSYFDTICMVCPIYDGKNNTRTNQSPNQSICCHNEWKF